MFNFSASFMISWSPYAAVCMYRAFIGREVSPMVATIPAFFAKSSLAWPSLLTIIGNSDVRNKLGFQSERLQKKNRISIVRNFFFLFR
jgi:hypothetical protein